MHLQSSDKNLLHIHIILSTCVFDNPNFKSLLWRSCEEKTSFTFYRRLHFKPAIQVEHLTASHSRLHITTFKDVQPWWKWGERNVKHLSVLLTSPIFSIFWVHYTFHSWFVHSVSRKANLRPVARKFASIKYFSTNILEMRHNWLQSKNLEKRELQP